MSGIGINTFPLFSQFLQVLSSCGRLAADRVERLLRLRNLRVARDDEEHEDAEERREEGSHDVLDARVALTRDEAGDHVAGHVVPRHRRREGETRNEGVEGLLREFGSHNLDLVGSGHVLIVLYYEKIILGGVLLLQRASYI